MVSPTNRTPSSKVGPEVLLAALAILDDEGPDGFTVRAIAQRAGVAPMAIYNHFNGVNGVLEALWTEGFVSLRDAMSVYDHAPEVDLYDAGLAYRAFALENRGLYTIMFMHRFRNFEPSRSAVLLATEAFQSLVTHVERCQAIGRFGDEAASDTAQIIWSACHGYVALELLDINMAADR
ncbi:MAG TPA: TetR/AcrR family transcriptional regulator, partial [Acidimicrobiales bacterium]|nr:TetR/AcrR family transcriptional regulator [Acidimicrobiales bacterium]